MSEQELLTRDAKRNIAAEIRRGMKKVRAKADTQQCHMEIPQTLGARIRSGLRAIARPRAEVFGEVLGLPSRESCKSSVSPGDGYKVYRE